MPQYYAIEMSPEFTKLLHFMHYQQYSQYSKTVGNAEVDMFPGTSQAEATVSVWGSSAPFCTRTRKARFQRVTSLHVAEYTLNNLNWCNLLDFVFIYIFWKWLYFALMKKVILLEKNWQWTSVKTTWGYDKYFLKNALLAHQVWEHNWFSSGITPRGHGGSSRGSAAKCIIMKWTLMSM